MFYYLGNINKSIIKIDTIEYISLKNNYIEINTINHGYVFEYNNEAEAEEDYNELKDFIDTMLDDEDY